MEKGKERGKGEERRGEERRVKGERVRRGGFIVIVIDGFYFCGG